MGQGGRNDGGRRIERKYGDCSRDERGERRGMGGGSGGRKEKGGGDRAWGVLWGIENA